MKEPESYYIIIGEKAYGYDQLVDCHTASAIIGLSARTVRDMAVRREIPVYRISRNVTRYLVRDLVEWSEAKRVEPDNS
jgi:hypothetical protein